VTGTPTVIADTYPGVIAKFAEQIEAISCYHDLLRNVQFGPILDYMEIYYFVYIMTNKHNTVLYTGVTNNLVRRVFEHKEKLIKGFTVKYIAVKLVYYEIHEDPYSAIAREKQIKGGSRQKKIELINEFNKDWKDLYREICS
jgi:putative endonuclease